MENNQIVAGTNTKEKFYEVIAKAISIGVEQVSDSLAYQEIPEWDSVSHLSIVTELESHYRISIEMNDVLEMGSVGKIMVLLKKYNIQIQ